MAGLHSDEGVQGVGPADFKLKEVKWVQHAPDPSQFYTAEVRDKLRRMYWAQAEPKPQAAACDVAVHIRRGDIVHKKAFKRRLVDDASFLKEIRAIKQADTARECKRFCVLSDAKDLDSFSVDLRTEPGVSFMLDKDL